MAPYTIVDASPGFFSMTKPSVGPGKTKTRSTGVSSQGAMLRVGVLAIKEVDLNCILFTENDLI